MLCKGPWHGDAGLWSVAGFPACMGLSHLEEICFPLGDWGMQAGKSATLWGHQSSARHGVVAWRLIRR